MMRTGKFHYAWLVIALTFLALLVSAGLRSAPGVMMQPLQLAFGWDRSVVSLSAAIGIFLYGLVGPFAAALLQAAGIRRTMMAGLTLMALSTLASLWMTQPWQYLLSWGVFSGLGTGVVALTLGSAIVNRWFAQRQGLVMGLLSASMATGSLIFIPAMAWMAGDVRWDRVALAIGIASALLIPVVGLLMPERPADRGVGRYGEAADAPAAHTAVRGAADPWLAITTLRRGMRQPMFWLLAGSFFVCGLTTNGLIGTHFIAYCGDRGIAPVQAAGLLSMMGFFDLIGTTLSGWLTDRYDPRRLLFVYYGVRGLSLVALPFIAFDGVSLTLFAIFYGLDWVATVPPTAKLSNLYFGERDAPIMLGWIFVGHQIGAATAAFTAGLVRQEVGTYQPALIAAGVMGVLAGGAMLALRGGLLQGRGEAASASA